MDWTQIVLIVHVPLVLLLMFGLKWLAKRYGFVLTESQWTLVQKAVDQGIQYAEKVSKMRKKVNNPMKSEEKLELAKGLTEQLLDRFKLGAYKGAAVGLIEAALNHIERWDRPVVRAMVEAKPEPNKDVPASDGVEGLDALKLPEKTDG